MHKGINHIIIKFKPKVRDDALPFQTRDVSLTSLMGEETYLAVVLEPLGRNSGDSVVLLLGALGTVECGLTTGLHGGEQLVILGLLEVCGFLCKTNYCNGPI